MTETTAEVTAAPSTTSPPHDERGWISVRGLTRRYGDAVGLHPLDLDIEPRSITGLLGPNGSGKSTLLRLLLGLVRPTAGRACVDGVALRGDGTAIRKRATYMPGEIAVYGEMRGNEHLRWLLRGRDRSALSRAREVAGELGLDLRRKVRAYSQGMKRQLFFAAALGPNVSVRILDEPTDGLDPTARHLVLELLRAEAARGVTILLSSHHLVEVEDACERLVFLNDGRLLASERTADLHERARTILRLSWSEPPDEVLAERLFELGATNVTLHGRLAIARTNGDPLAYLARMNAAPGMQPPTAVDFGRLSLSDLYRDLYGVEGL